MPRHSAHQGRGAKRDRRGTALVAMLVLLALMALVAFATAKSGARDQIASLDRMQGRRAQYAVEAVANIAVKEVLSDTDLDADGGIGTISNDSNAATDPTINNGTRMWVTREDANGVATLTAHAENADAARAMQIAVTYGQGGASVYYSKSGSSNVYMSTWDGAAWTESIVATMSANGLWFRAVRNPGQTVTVLGATDADSKITGMTATTGSFGSATTLVSNAGYTTVRKFDIAFEQSSGDGMVAYSNGSSYDVECRIITGSSIGALSNVMSGSTYFDCVRLVSRAGSDELLLLASDANEDLRVRLWNGSSWGTTTTLSTSVVSAYKEASAGVYMQSSGKPLVVYCKNNTAAPKYRVYSSSAWSAEASMAECSDTPQSIHMAARPGTDEAVCAILDKNAEIRVYMWNGTSWTSNLKVESNAGIITSRPFDLAWTADGSKLLMVYGDNTSTPKYRTFDGTTWSSEHPMSNMTHAPRWVQVAPASTGSAMMVGVSDTGLDLHTWAWTGTAMGPMSAVAESLGGSTTTEQFWMMADEGGTTLTISGWSPTSP